MRNRAYLPLGPSRRTSKEPGVAGVRMRTEVTELLERARENDREALDRLVPILYEELKTLARRHRARWGRDRAPGTTSVVHETYAKLVDQDRIDAATRAQFFALASRVMRSVLIDNARWHARRKRGGGARPLSLDEAVLVTDERAEDFLALDEALQRLERMDGRLGRIVECRFFGGLTIEEAAEAIGISPASVKRGWTMARSWLHRELRPAEVE